MRIIFYFAVDRFENYKYLSERPTIDNNPNNNQLIDLVDDMNKLKSEFNWSKLDEEHMPHAVGCYQAVVECNQDDNDDYEFIILSCTPLMYL